jgi:hypothetical protein
MKAEFRVICVSCTDIHYIVISNKTGTVTGLIHTGAMRMLIVFMFVFCFSGTCTATNCQRLSQFCWRCTCVSEYVRKVCKLYAQSHRYMYYITLYYPYRREWVSWKSAQEGRSVLTDVSDITFRACTLRRYEVLNVKNAVVNDVSYCVTEYTICNLVL